MHDQYVMEICPQAKHTHEKKHRELRQRQKRAIDAILDTTTLLLDWPDDEPLSKPAFWQQVNEAELRTALDDLRAL